MKSFTLIEVLIVLGIIVILSFLVAPAIRNYQPSFQLSGLAREIITDLRYIQQLAITEQVEYCLKIFSLEKKYQIKQCDSQENIKDEIKTIQVKPSGFVEISN